MSYVSDIFKCALLGTVLIGCNGDGTTSDGSGSDSNNTTNGESNSGTETSGTEEPTTEDSTTEGPTTEEPTTEEPTTEEPTTEEPTTEEPTTEDPTTEDPTTEDPSESDTTTDGGKMCGVADGDYGPCEAIIGYAFNGESCELRSGCGCEDDCELFFDELSECTSTCAGAGFCNSDVFTGEALGMNPFVQGNFCDEVDVCTPNSVLDDVELLFPDLFSCEGNGFPCDQQLGQKCTVQWSGEVGPEIWAQLCEASLVPNINKIACVVWGP